MTQQPPKIANVYAFDNGMCMVFDQYGHQMPEFQGRTDDMRDKIRAVYDGPFEGSVWRALGDGETAQKEKS